MMSSYNPANWYWKAQDGRVFASARVAVVGVDDPDFVAWQDTGKFPTVWPKDDDGQQTVAELQKVLSPYGLYADLVSYAAAVRYTKEIGGITVAGVRVSTDDRSKQMIMGARIAAVADPAFTTPWVGSDGAISSLNAEQIVGISDAVLTHVQACFATFATVAAEIASGSVNTPAQVDAAFAA